MSSLQELLAIAKKAAKRLRFHAQVTIDSNVRRGLPPEQQDEYWREGMADKALAAELDRLARRGPSGRTLKALKARRAWWPSR